MKVILLKDVTGQGKRSDVIEVADGYARNYLIPRGLAVTASKGKIKELADLRQNRAQKEKKLEQQAKELAARLNSLTVVIGAKAGEGGRLFGSVNNKDIADALADEYNIKLDKKKLVLKEPIKQLGEFSITAKLHPAVQSQIEVRVVDEEQ
jgi:large subunit ribosomal protein L9